MLLSKEEIKAQVRGLWRTCFPKDSEEFLDIYFEDRYSDDVTVTVRENARVVAATQVLPFRFNFAGSAMPVGYISGLCTDPEYRKKGYAGKILHDAHRKLFAEGGVLSLLIPGDEKLREFYQGEQNGAYWTSTHQLTVDVAPPAEFKPDLRIDVMPEYEWGRDLWIYYNTFGGRHAFEIKHNEDSFFAAIQTHDLEDGLVLVARKRGKILGFCLVVKEGKPLKSGKLSTKNFRGHIRFMLTTDERIMHQLQYRAMELLEVKDLVMTGGAPCKGFKTSRPYVMARVINVEKFLTHVARIHTGLQLHIGVQNDLHIPENNGYYLIENGKVRITDAVPPSIVTPGGLAALFLGSQPVFTPMMLDV